MNPKRLGKITAGAVAVAAVAWALSLSSSGPVPGPGMPPAGRAPRTYVVVKPGTHPGILFSKQELAALRRRAHSRGLAGDAYREIQRIARRPSNARLTLKQAVGRPGERLARQLDCMALVYQVEGDRRMGRRAIRLFQAVATGIDPVAFYRVVNSDFFATEHWPKAFAYAWDWLYELMTPAERAPILKSLERWAAALDAHTDRWWWRDASYNCGAIPVGAEGLLCTAIRGESHDPNLLRWYSDSFRKIRDNYFPLTWRANGICNEGPGYAHYHKNPTLFAEAVRRTGGPDIIPGSGAVNAMHYLRFQWLPQGGCAPIGDNTGYGRRVFQSIYLHGIRELGDRAGLWTFEKYTARDRIDPLLLFLLYPDHLEPASPGTLDLRTSFYFEITPNRAGYVFARSAWDDEQAAFFAFVTRYAEANHAHYDMDSFLFSAFGDALATHANIYPYSDPNHGVDFEHNIVIIDRGGMPAADRPSAGDDGSLNGYLMGVGLGHFADYVRGDAHRSYADRSVPSTTPAVRADRLALFVKQGPNPYVVIADDIQKDGRAHDYHWQWYTPAHTLAGRGTFGKPFRIEGAHARCAIAFLEPRRPRPDFRVVTGGHPHHRVALGLLRVNQRGVRVRFLAVGAAWRKGAPRPRLRPGPSIEGHPAAASLVVEGRNFRDVILWQPIRRSVAQRPVVSCGRMRTDARMAVVRTTPAGKVVGYVMGEGTLLRYGGRLLARGPRPFSVSADAKRTVATGARRARQGRAPFPARGSVWLPAPGSELWVDGRRRPRKTSPGQRVRLSDSRTPSP